jgi:L-alanine-DL-glutamate epimerase-like enolase superfamily enzyme
MTVGRHVRDSKHRVYRGLLQFRRPHPAGCRPDGGHRWRLRGLVHHQAVDILQLNVTYCGGVAEARKAAHLAQTYNLPIANGGGWPLFNMHLLAGMMNGWYVEWRLGMVAVGERLFKDAPKPANGLLRVPDRPGLGRTLDRDAWRDTRVAV